MKKSHVVQLVTGVFAIGLAWILIDRSIMAPRRNFERFLKVLATAKVGATKLEDLRQQLAQEQVSNLVLKCEGQEGSVGLRVENKFLKEVRLSPQTIADAGVGFANGTASEIYIALVIAKKNDNGEWRDDKGVVVRETTERIEACSPHFDVSVKGRYGTSDRDWATVAMGPCVQAEDRAKALAFNCACLTRIGGCSTVEAILPKVFTKP